MNPLKTFLIVLAVGVAACASPAPTDAPSETQNAPLTDNVEHANFEGVFTTQVSNGSSSSETIFYTDADGHLQGVYFLHFDERQFPGYFSGLTLDRSTRTVSGVWHDHWGVGSMAFTFAEDGRSFTGIYSGLFSWSGEKL